ncbi:hypothetical protein V1477_008713 [Vespula maculifrons]|uniref:Uncharacterized protein n=2 Tax=Vespula TaxID=7451 RepID=A0A834MZG0_VESVU|nr:hypothetical protein HZH66_009575 [Vespula vulgaris]
MALSGQFTGFTGNAFESPSFSGFKLVDGVQAETIEATTVTSKVTRSEDVYGSLDADKMVVRHPTTNSKVFLRTIISYALNSSSENV